MISNRIFYIICKQIDCSVLLICLLIIFQVPVTTPPPVKKLFWENVIFGFKYKILSFALNLHDLVLLNLFCRRYYWCFERVHLRFNMMRYWSSVQHGQSDILFKTKIILIWPCLSQLGVFNIIVDCCIVVTFNYLQSH